jgi:hypothetical protein
MCKSDMGLDVVEFIIVIGQGSAVGFEFKGSIISGEI